MKVILVVLSLILLTLPVELRAQAGEFENKQKSDKTLISVPVTVSDREGHYIPNLKKEDFTLYQNDVKQNISFFARYDEPLNIALLLDTSGSTEKSLAKIKDAAKDFIDLLTPNDKCLIATFDSQVNILNAFSSNSQTLKESLNRVGTAREDGTVLHRAIEQIARNSFISPEGRKVILILSDGKDIGSSVTRPDLLGLLEESDILIYTIYYKTGEGFSKLVIDSGDPANEGLSYKKTKKKQPKIKKKKGYSITIPAQAGQVAEAEIELREGQADIEAVDFLKKMSDTTAGRFYFSDTPNLKDIFKKVAAELRQQYRLGYRSKDGSNDAAVSSIVVKVDRPDVVVRARGKFRAKQL